MSEYSIKYLENITGIKAHTIRIWEKRYHLLEPRRTATNIRYYNDDDLKKILNVITLLGEGYKISKIGEMQPAEIATSAQAALATPQNPNQLYDYFTNEIVAAALTYDKRNLEKLIGACILKFTFADTIEHVLYPALKRTGILWQSDEANPGQEHFFSNFVRKKLFSAIDAMPEPAPGSTNCLLFLPDNEDHEIGLLYFYYLLLQYHIPATYLGQRTPFDSLLHAAEMINPTHLVLFITTSTPAHECATYLQDLSKAFRSKKIILCGSGYIEKMKLPSNCVFLPTPTHAKKYFAQQ